MVNNTYSAKDAHPFRRTEKRTPGMTNGGASTPPPPPQHFYAGARVEGASKGRTYDPCDFISEEATQQQRMVGFPMPLNMFVNMNNIPPPQPAKSSSKSRRGMSQENSQGFSQPVTMSQSRHQMSQGYYLTIE